MPACPHFSFEFDGKCPTQSCIYRADSNDSGCMLIDNGYQITISQEQYLSNASRSTILRALDGEADLTETSNRLFILSMHIRWQAVNAVSNPTTTKLCPRCSIRQTVCEKGTLDECNSRNKLLTVLKGLYEPLVWDIQLSHTLFGRAIWQAINGHAEERLPAKLREAYTQLSFPRKAF